MVLLSVYQHTVNASLVIRVPTHHVQTAWPTQQLHRDPDQDMFTCNLTPRHDSLGGVTLHGPVNKSLHSVKASELHQARAQNGSSTCNTHMCHICYLPCQEAAVTDARLSFLLGYMRVMVETAQLKDACGLLNVRFLSLHCP